MRHRRRLATAYAFTLAELLIALAILGVIATFTIPKVLQAQQSQQNVAITKEAFGLLSSAYQRALLDGAVSSSSTPGVLLPYLNYVQYDTSGSLIDAQPNFATNICNNTNPCVRLHNGAVLWFGSPSFGGSTALNAIMFVLDPNGQQDITTTADGPGKAIQIVLYYNGAVTSRGAVRNNTCTSTACPFGPNPSLDPSWFHWD